MFKVQNKYNYFIIVPNLIWIMKIIYFYYTNDVLNDRYLGSKYLAHILLSIPIVLFSLILMVILNKSKWKPVFTDYGWMFLIYLLLIFFVMA